MKTTAVLCESEYEVVRKLMNDAALELLAKTVVIIEGSIRFDQPMRELGAGEIFDEARYCAVLLLFRTFVSYAIKRMDVLTPLAPPRFRTEKGTASSGHDRVEFVAPSDCKSYFVVD